MESTKSELYGTLQRKIASVDEFPQCGFLKRSRPKFFMDARGSKVTLWRETKRQQTAVVYMPSQGSSRVYALRANEKQCLGI